MTSNWVLSPSYFDLAELAPSAYQEIGIPRLLTVQERTRNGWVPNVRGTGLGAGDMIVSRRNHLRNRPLKGGHTSAQIWLYDFTDSVVATWREPVIGQKMTSDLQTVSSTAAIMRFVRSQLSNRQITPQKRAAFAELLRRVFVRHRLAIDLDGQVVASQAEAAAPLQDKLGRRNDAAMQARLSAGIAGAERREATIKTTVANNRSKGAWAAAQFERDQLLVAQIIELVTELEDLSQWSERLMNLAVQVRYKPTVLTLNNAYFHRHETDSKEVLLSALEIFEPLYGWLISPFLLVASASASKLRKHQADYLERTNEVIESLQTIRVGGDFNQRFDTWAEIAGDLKQALEAGDWTKAKHEAETGKHYARYVVLPGETNAPGQWYCGLADAA